MLTFNDKLKKLLDECEDGPVKHLLTEAWKLSQPNWRVGTVKIKQRNCPTGCKGKTFKGRSF